MRVFIGCEESGTVVDSFLDAGHIAVSCDLEPTRGKNPLAHFQMDVMKCLRAFPDGYFDLAILFPDCTAMTTAGNRHYTDTHERDEAIRWTLELWDLAKRKAQSCALENPRSVIWPMIRPHCMDIQLVQPYWFGHPVRKATGFALWNLKRLVATNQLSRSEVAAIPKEELAYISNIGNGPNRKRDRSVTFKGIADAMTQQWGDKTFSRVANGFPQRA